MFLNSFKNTYLLLVLLLISCAKPIKTTEKKSVLPKKEPIELKTGAERTDLYLTALKGKNVAVVANQTSVIRSLVEERLKVKDQGLKTKEERRKMKDERQKPQDQRGKTEDQKLTTLTSKSVHLVDSLLSLNIAVKKVFAPEHGFRGKADAGELIKDGIDTKTGLPIISLYGKNKKPSPEQLKNIDVVIFDIQDVGARFYTYISTLHYVMEACAEANIPVIVLDRPNPNGHYIDGPVLEPKHKSFVGMHKVPVIYGMTIGEYGKMINGEQWLQNNIQCNLTVVPLQGYTHKTKYSLPVAPSPNLPNDVAINLYPSLCFFEGTNVSAGRGTNKQFQIYGSPYLEKTDFSFTPISNEGAKHPKHKNRVCYGENLTNTKFLSRLDLSWLIKAHKQTSKVKTKFWNNFFTKLAGTEKLQNQISKGLSEKEIRASWQKDLDEFKKVRSNYLLY